MSKSKDTKWRKMVLMVVPTVRTIFNEDGLVTIVFPRYQNKWLIKLLVNKKRKNEIRLDFDELGTAVWKLINGIRSVEDILEELHAISEKEDQFEQRTVRFLAGLYQHRLLISR